MEGKHNTFMTQLAVRSVARMDLDISGYEVVMRSEPMGVEVRIKITHDQLPAYPLDSLWMFSCPVPSSADARIEALTPKPEQDDQYAHLDGQYQIPDRLAVEEKTSMTAEEEHIQSLENCIKGLMRGSKDRGGCWCEKGIGNPMLSDHTKQCKDTRELMGMEEG